MSAEQQAAAAPTRSRDQHVLDFRDALISIRQSLRGQDWAQLIAEPVDTARLEEQLPDAIRERLLRAMDAVAPDDEAPSPGTAAASPRQIMAVVADAVLLHEVAWPGRDRWARQPLQSRSAPMPHDNAAFDQAHAIARTLALALDLGYLGSVSHDDEVHASARRLVEVVYRFEPAAWHPIGDLMAGGAQHFPAPADRHPAATPWWLAAGAICAAGLVVTWQIWKADVGPTVDAATQATSAAAAGTR